MFSRKKKSQIDITHDDPVFHVIYLGNQMIEKLKQPDSVLKTVWSLWKRNGRHCKKVTVSIGIAGVKVNEKHELFGQSATSYTYPLHNVSYCVANKELCGVFAWLESAGSRADTRCHAVVCDTSSTARTMATLLTDCCAVLRNEMVSRARRTERQKALEKRLVTERMRINTIGYHENEMADDDDVWGFSLRSRPLQGGLIEDDMDITQPAAQATLKCMRVGDIQYTEIQNDEPILLVESRFSWVDEEDHS